MNKSHMRWIARITILGTHLGLLGLVVLQRRKGGSAFATAAIGFFRRLGASSAATDAKPHSFHRADKEPAEMKPRELVSLSLKVAGDAPLDRLAREAVSEEKRAGEPGPEKHDSDGHSSAAGAATQPWSHADVAVSELLEHQDLQAARLADWSEPATARLAVPTFAPAVMALGIIVFAMGLATIWYVCVIGAAVFAVAAWRWTGQLQGR